jgi:selenide,water dikinase
LVDAALKDDAAVFQISEDRAIVATVDFFAPIVDDPYAFGAIAAANALSDVYAMGATPLFALNLVAWPRAPEMLSLLEDAIRGLVDKVAEAGAFILGGHSIDDPEPKLGLVAVGEAHPNQILTNARAHPGDALVLTKPLGTGILSTALKRDAIGDADLEEAVRSMAHLNAGAARAVSELGSAVHATTDVTGFGLLGHLHNLLNASGCGARVFADRIPALGGVHGLIERDIIPGGTVRNLEAARGFTKWPDRVRETDRVLLADAQTSGGLLIAVDAGAIDALLSALERELTPTAVHIGDVMSPSSPPIEVVLGR